MESIIQLRMKVLDGMSWSLTDCVAGKVEQFINTNLTSGLAIVDNYAKENNMDTVMWISLIIAIIGLIALFIPTGNHRHQH